MLSTPSPTVPPLHVIYLKKKLNYRKTGNALDIQKGSSSFDVCDENRSKKDDVEEENSCQIIGRNIIVIIVKK